MLLAISQLARLSPDNYPRIQQANILPRVRSHALYLYSLYINATVRLPCEPHEHNFLVEETIVSNSWLHNQAAISTITHESFRSPRTVMIDKRCVDVFLPSTATNAPLPSNTPIH